MYNFFVRKVFLSGLLRKKASITDEVKKSLRRIKYPL